LWRPVAAEGQEIGCGHAGSVHADHRPGDFPVPDALQDEPDQVSA
jgi:hypothetical protein